MTVSPPLLPSPISTKFRFWAFISMVLLVFVHGYNLETRFLQPWTLPGEPLTFTGFTEYFLANGIFRFRIPMLFIISGYLFALHDYRPYRQRTGKRLRTLLVPYLLWSALGIAFVWILGMFPWSRTVVASSGVVHIDNTRVLLQDFRWYELLATWILFPVPYQLWFIRVLLIYNIAYPAIRWCVLHRIARWPFFVLAILLWLSTSGFVLIEGEGVLFFSLGVLLQKKDFNIASPAKWLNPLVWGIVFVGLSAGKTLLAFLGQPLLGTAVFPVLAMMHKIVVLSGLITCWYGLDRIVFWLMGRRWFAWLSAFAFIIYAMHTPLVALAINPVLDLLQPFVFARLTAYIMLPLLVIACCIGTGAMLRRVVPKAYGLLTGGRGL